MIIFCLCAFYSLRRLPGASHVTRQTYALGWLQGRGRRKPAVDPLKMKPRGRAFDVIILVNFRPRSDECRDGIQEKQIMRTGRIKKKPLSTRTEMGYRRGRIWEQDESKKALWTCRVSSDKRFSGLTKREDLHLSQQVEMSLCRFGKGKRGTKRVIRRGGKDER